MRDSQKTKVYKWEGSIRERVGPSRNPLKESLSAKRTYHTIAVNMYGIRSAKIKQHAGRRHSEYFNIRGEIRFRANADLWTVLHESAHHITWTCCDYTGHGPLFTRVLVDMAVAFDVASEQTLLQLAYLGGVRVAHRSEVPRPMLDTLPRFLRKEE